MAIGLTTNQRSELSSIAQSRSLPAGYVFRRQAHPDAGSRRVVQRDQGQLQSTAPTIVRWKQRFLQSGLDGLDTYHPGQKATLLTPALRARILSATRKKPSDVSTHWSCRKLAAALGVSKDAVHRVWKEAGLKPHRVERHGTLSLYAAMDTKTGPVHGKTAARHTSRDFVAFLEEVVSLSPPRQQIHIILDNLSAHKTQLVQDFLPRHPRVQFHFTPTYSSWLNQIEIWFANIEREVIARGIFCSVPALALASSAATSTPTPPTLAPSSGNTLTLLAAYVLTNSLRQSTRIRPHPK